MVALSVKEEIFLVLALSGKVSPWQYKGHRALWEIDWPTFQSTDGGSVPAGQESWLFFNVLSMLPHPPTLHLVLGESAS